MRSGAARRIAGLLLLAAGPVLVLGLLFVLPVTGMVAEGFVADGRFAPGAVLEVLARPRVHRVAWFTVWTSGLATLLVGRPRPAGGVRPAPARAARPRRGPGGAARAVRAADRRRRGRLPPAARRGRAARLARPRRHAVRHHLRPGLLQRRRRGAHRRRRVGVPRPAARAGGGRARRLAVAGAAHGDAARPAAGDRGRGEHRLPLLRDGVRHRAHPRRRAPRDGRDRDLPADHDRLRPAGGRRALGAADRRGGRPAGARRAPARRAGPDRPADGHARPGRTPRRRARASSRPCWCWPRCSCRSSRWCSARCGSTAGGASANYRALSGDRRQPGAARAGHVGPGDQPAHGRRRDLDGPARRRPRRRDRHPPLALGRRAPGALDARRLLHAAARGQRGDARLRLPDHPRPAAARPARLAAPGADGPGARRPARWSCAR